MSTEGRSTSYVKSSKTFARAATRLWFSKTFKDSGRQAALQRIVEYDKDKLWVLSVARSELQSAAGAADDALCARALDGSLRDALASLKHTLSDRAQHHRRIHAELLGAANAARVRAEEAATAHAEFLRSQRGALAAPPKPKPTPASHPAQPSACVLATAPLFSELDVSVSSAADGTAVTVTDACSISVSASTSDVDDDEDDDVDDAGAAYAHALLDAQQLEHALEVMGAALAAQQERASAAEAAAGVFLDCASAQSALQAQRRQEALLAATLCVRSAACTVAAQAYAAQADAFGESCADADSLSAACTCTCASGSSIPTLAEAMCARPDAARLGLDLL